MTVTYAPIVSLSAVGAFSLLGDKPLRFTLQKFAYGPDEHGCGESGSHLALQRLLLIHFAKIKPPILHRGFCRNGSFQTSLCTSRQFSPATRLSMNDGVIPQSRWCQLVFDASLKFSQ